RWPDPAIQWPRLDRKKQLGVPLLPAEDSVAEKPGANEPERGWRHPTPPHNYLQRSENAGTCEAPWCTFGLPSAPRNESSPKQTLATDGHQSSSASLRAARVPR